MKILFLISFFESQTIDNNYLLWGTLMISERHNTLIISLKMHHFVYTKVRKELLGISDLNTLCTTLVLLLVIEWSTSDTHLHTVSTRAVFLLKKKAGTI